MVVEIVFKKHNEWISLVEKFGCNRDTAEDLVQEMYIKIQKRVEAGTDIMFDEHEVNYFYILTTLHNLYLDLKRKENKVVLVDIDDFQIEIDENLDILDVYERVQEQLLTYHWYDQKIYEIVESGEPIARLSRKTRISYYSLYNTYNKVKKGIKRKLNL